MLTGDGMFTTEDDKPKQGKKNKIIPFQVFKLVKKQKQFKKKKMRVGRKKRRRRLSTHLCPKIKYRLLETRLKLI
jgi:hypothetical protein